MNQCTPYQASELTDVLLNCCTNVLTVIQTAANGEESMMSADLTCLVDKFNTLDDAQINCETGILTLSMHSGSECEDDTTITVDLSCLDTYVTWVDNGDGSITFISADGTETIGAMRDCEGIAHQPTTDPTDMIVMCKADGSTVKGTLEEVISAGYSICKLPPFDLPVTPETEFEFGVCVDGFEYRFTLNEIKTILATHMEDGFGTDLIGDGSEDTPFRVDLNVCELPTEVYDQNAVITGCIGGASRNMPAINAGDNVTINESGRLDVDAGQSGCEMPHTNYNVNANVVTCSAGNEVTMPAIKPGDRVTRIKTDGTLDVDAALVFVNNGNPITIFSTGETSANDLPKIVNFDVRKWVPHGATGLIVRTYAECDNGGHTGDHNVPVEISIRVDNRVINGAETGGHPIYDPSGDNSSWNDAIVPHTPNYLNISVILHYGDPNIVGYQAKAYLVGYFN